MTETDHGVAVARATSSGASRVAAVLNEIEPVLGAVRTESPSDELSRVLPHHHVAALGKTGFGALRIPVEAGGAGLDLVDLLDVIIAVAAADSNLAHIWRNHFAVVETLRRSASPQARAKWFGEIVNGAFFATGMTERDTHTPAGGGELLTQLHERAGELRLDGAKYYSTGSLYADWVLVRAGWNGERVNVVVHLRADGVTVDDDWDGFGQRASGSGTLMFTGVRVNREDVVVHGRGGPGQAGEYGGAFAQLFLTTVLAGITRAVADDAIDLVRARTRNYYHAPAAEPVRDPLVQNVVGELQSNAFVARAAVLEAARALDRAATAAPDDRAGSAELGRQATLAASQAKVVLDGLATGSATRLLDAGGASATARGRNLDRHWRNARTLVSHNPTAHKARVLGDHLLNGTPLPAGGFF